MAFSVKLLLVCLLLSPSSDIQQWSVDTDGHMTPQVFRRGHSSVFFCCTAITGSREDPRVRRIIRMGLLSAPWLLFFLSSVFFFVLLQYLSQLSVFPSILESNHPGLLMAQDSLDLMPLWSWIWPSRFFTFLFFFTSFTFKLKLGQLCHLSVMTPDRHERELDLGTRVGWTVLMHSLSVFEWMCLLGQIVSCLIFCLSFALKQTELAAASLAAFPLRLQLCKT